jgi:membrane protease YdiL (CAAX protease family)
MNIKEVLTMSDLDKQTEFSDSPIIRYWQHIPVFIRAMVSGVFVSTIGVGAWLLSLSAIPAPWSVAVMGGILWLYWKYFSGSWWPRATAEARRNNFRAVELSADVWKWGLVGAFLFVVVMQSGAVLTVRIIEFPAEASAGYNLDALPVWEAWIIIVMASLVAGICEETGFRGYMQVPLEERYGPAVGITIVSIVFVVFHLHQAWAQPVLFQIFAISVLLGILAYASGSLILGIIGHTIIDIVNFSFWWSDLAGKFEMQTIAETGIDIHFVTWVLIFGAAIALFFWVTRKIMAVRQQT